MPRALLEACHGGCGSGNKDYFSQGQLAGDSWTFEHTSQRSKVGLPDDVLRPAVFRGRRLRSSYGDFLQGPELPSDVATSSRSRTDQSGSFDDERRPASIPPAAAQALAAQISAELKDAMQTIDAMKAQVRTAPFGGQPGRANLDYWVAEDGDDGKEPVLEHYGRNESDVDHKIYHGPEPSSSTSHHVLVKKHVAAKVVHRPAEPPMAAAEAPSKAKEPLPQQELDQEAVQQLQEPRLADWQPQIILGGAIALFAQAYLWGNVFVTIFKPARSSGATQPVEATQAPAVAPASAPFARIVLSGAGGRLQEQAPAAATEAVSAVGVAAS
eukprot:TRINITY_DN96862_c0_g1_i1.p1 TRINITY_DN96862_c0_g1~~TRINITY_DN96862_c0_g1_i1.p1  ORF type:complete len:327 (-),score=61.91 TRINITY_DN96862_c0_g1_i1:91-1071(-)